MNFDIIIYIIFFVIFLIIILSLFSSIRKNKEEEKEEIIKEKDNEIKKEKYIEKQEETKKPEEIELKDNYFIKLQNNQIDIDKEFENAVKICQEELQLEEEMIKELINETISLTKNNKNLIFQLLEEKNYEKLEREIHKLKGSAVNLKFNLLGKPLTIINNLLREIINKEDPEKEKLLKKYIEIFYNIKILN